MGHRGDSGERERMAEGEWDGGWEEEEEKEGRKTGRSEGGRRREEGGGMWRRREEKEEEGGGGKKKGNQRLSHLLVIPFLCRFLSTVRRWMNKMYWTTCLT